MPALPSLTLPIAAGLAAVVSALFSTVGGTVFEPSVSIELNSSPAMAVHGIFTHDGGRDVIFGNLKTYFANNIARYRDIESLGIINQTSMTVLRRGPGGIDQLFTTDGAQILQLNSSPQVGFSTTVISGSWGNISKLLSWTSADGRAFLCAFSDDTDVDIFERIGGTLTLSARFTIPAGSQGLIFADIDDSSPSPEVIVGFPAAVVAYNFDGTENRINPMAGSSEPKLFAMTRGSGTGPENVMFTVGSSLYRFDASLQVGQATLQQVLTFAPTGMQSGQLGTQDPLLKSTHLLVTSNDASETILITNSTTNYPAANNIQVAPHATGLGSGAAMFADFDGDGDNDVVFANSASNSLCYVSGTWQQESNLVSKLDSAAERAGSAPREATLPSPSTERGKIGVPISVDLWFLDPIETTAPGTEIYLNIYEATYADDEIVADAASLTSLLVTPSVGEIGVDFEPGVYYLMEVTSGDQEGDDSQPAEFYLTMFDWTTTITAPMPVGITIHEKTRKKGGKNSGIIRRLPPRRRPTVN